MKTRTTVKIISFLSAGIIVSVGFGIKAHLKSEKYKLEIQNNYSHSLDEFTSAVNNISVILKKAQYSTTPEQLSLLATELLSEAEISKSALSQLPTNSTLDVLNRFLSQAGNYAMAVSSMLYNGEALPEDYNQNITALSTTADKVATAVSTAQINHNNLDYWAKEIENKIDKSIDKTLAASLSSLEGELSDYPTLVYDGPYSDHILKKEAALLADKPNISQEKAHEIAANATQADKSQLEFTALEEGKIPVYRFSGKDTQITVSKAGGEVVYMRKYRTVGDNVLSYEQAVDKAKRYLDTIGKINFLENYYFTDEGVCVINFAFLDGQTICYTDLIKVGIAMDNGEVMLYEASGYLTNHRERAFETPAYTLQQAKQVISDSLKIKSTALALIPKNSADEVRCYEFLCTNAAKEEVLVYINALTLAEEDILILLKSDGGTLVK